MAFQKNRRHFSRIGGFLLVNFSSVFDYFGDFFRRFWSIKTWENIEKELKQNVSYDSLTRARHLVKAHISFEQKKNLHVEKLHKEFLDYKIRQTSQREQWLLKNFEQIECIKRKKE